MSNSITNFLNKIFKKKTTKTGKNFKIFGIRGSLIGDSVFALPILHYLEKTYPNSYKYWQVARKCAQSAPLYFNHPLIDKILISDCEEGFGPKDIEIANQCDVVFNLMPEHPFQQDWPNYRNVYEETWVMAGLPIEEFHKLTPEQKRPKLYPWFNIKLASTSNVAKGKKVIAIWPCAGYGKEHTRNPNREWYVSLVKKLTEQGYCVWQFGHPKDFSIADESYSYPENSFVDLRDYSFFEQIQYTLGCDLQIGTDSGSSIVIGAYELIPQISLLTNHWTGHVKNDTAFGTCSPLNTNLFSRNGFSNLKENDVIEQVNKILNTTITTK